MPDTDQYEGKLEGEPLRYPEGEGLQKLIEALQKEPIDVDIPVLREISRHVKDFKFMGNWGATSEEEPEEYFWYTSLWFRARSKIFVIKVLIPWGDEMFKRSPAVVADSSITDEVLDLLLTWIAEIVLDYKQYPYRYQEDPPHPKQE